MSKKPVSAEAGGYPGILRISVGGVPILYVLLSLGLIIILGFIPASVVIGDSGGGWPLHDGIHPLVGVVLGPLAGALVSAVGFALSNIITPYTSLGAYSFLIGAMSAFTVGMLTQRHKPYWLVPWLIIAAAHVVFFFETRGFDISSGLWFSNTFTVTAALLITAVPAVRRWCWETIANGRSTLKLGLAYYIIYFLGSTGGIQIFWTVIWPINPWAPEFWPELVPVILLERTLFPLFGAIITAFFIPALRQSDLPKSPLAGY